MKFAETIAALRKRQGLTQAQLAEALNMTSAAVSKWETGAGGPDLDTLVALADYFHVTVDELLGHTAKKVRVVVLCPDEKVERAIRRTLDKYGYQLLGVSRSVEGLEALLGRLEEQGEKVNGMITAEVLITDAVRKKIMDLKSRYNNYMEWLGNESVSEDMVEAWLAPLLAEEPSAEARRRSTGS